MNRSLNARLLALAASVAVVMSCDAGAPTGLPEFGGAPIGGTTSGGGTPAAGGDGRAPVASIDTPSVRGALHNIGDSILVAVRVRDNQSGIRSLTIQGLAVRGSRDLGTERVTERYQSVTVPAGATPPVAGGVATTGPTLPAGTAVARDTVIRRYLKPGTVADTVQDSLVIRAIVFDHSGLADTAEQVVRLVSGPRVTIVSPVANDSVLPGTRLNVNFRVTHVEGISRVAVRVQGDTNWSPRLDTTLVRLYSGVEREISDTGSVLIPRGVPGRSRITVTAEAIDVNRVPGQSAPTVLRVRGSPPDAPRVTQTVPARAEVNDTVIINATGDGFRTIGFIVRDSIGTVLRRDSVVFPIAAQDLSPRRVVLPLGLGPSTQGRRVNVVSFATDRNGRTGYSVAASNARFESNLALAFADSSLIVFGRTFRLPRNGIAGDIAVDTVRRNVFISNTAFNRLEVFKSTDSTFDANGVAVGAEPWGMTVSATSPDTLLVANSGGTNISRVAINNTNVSNIRESSRILTRNTIAYQVTETRDPATNKIRIQVTGPFSYSDRPQYIAQSAAGRIFYSTRPTSANTAGTLRYLDPAQEVPDSRQIWQYGAPSRTLGQYTIFDVDGVGVAPSQADSPESDTLVVCDHPTGTRQASRCVRATTGVGAAVDSLQRMGADLFTAAVDIASLALNDTNFVAWSGDRRFIAFGEGNTGGTPGRVIAAFDPAGTPDRGTAFSDGVDIADLVDNASEPVFGLALDRTGRAIGVHGRQSYFGAVEFPFHLRMQGRVDTFDAGAGIAFHPLADTRPDVPSDPNTRLAFVASANGTIEIVDAFYYVSRGRIPVRNQLYGPLRAALPTVAEIAAGVRVKLYGLTSQGLVVIDVTGQDIRPAP